eukprot:COSAG01_NODE_7911_length_2996_cov_5.467380_1_plen_70_part_10
MLPREITKGDLCTVEHYENTFTLLRPRGEERVGVGSVKIVNGDTVRVLEVRTDPNGRHGPAKFANVKKEA